MEWDLGVLTTEATKSALGFALEISGAGRSCKQQVFDWHPQGTGYPHGCKEAHTYQSCAACLTLKTTASRDEPLRAHFHGRSAGMRPVFEKADGQMQISVHVA